MRDIKKSRMLAELNALSLEQIRKLDRKVLGDLIWDLNRNHDVTFKQIHQITRIPISTLQRLSNPPKKDTTQMTNRYIERGLDFRLLLDYFKQYMPKSDEERNELKMLSAVLLDCSRR